MGDAETFNPEVCRIRHQIVESRCDTLEDEMNGVRADLREVRDLQKQILYTLIGLFGATILTLIGVLAGRIIDFGVFLR